MKQTKNVRKAGFTLVEIMIVVSIIGLLAALAIPSFVRARTNSERATCINNLRQIDAATQEWAVAQRAAPSDVPNYSDIVPYMKNVVVCPSGGTTMSDSYTLSPVTNVPSCKKVVDHVLPITTAN